MTSPTPSTVSPSAPAASPGTTARAHAALLALAVLALLTGMTALQAVSAPPAAAHDVLVGTVPKDGSTVQRVPGQVRLLFEEPPLELGTQVVVTGPDGKVAQGKPVIDGSTVRQQVATGAPAGKYTVDYRVTSDDGHVVSGSFSFTARQGAAGTAAGDSPSGATATPLAPEPSASASAGGPTPGSTAAHSTQTAGAASTSAASAGSDKGMSWPVPPSILAWGIVLIVLILAGLTWLVRRVRGRGGHDDEQG